MGREPRPRDPIFIKTGNLPKRVTIMAIKRRMELIIERAGLRQRQKVVSGRRALRHDIPMMNGFRRFWNKTYKESMSDDASHS